MYNYKYKFDNIHLFKDVITEGKHNIPLITPTNIDNCEFIGFNYAKTSKKFDKGIHFFLDDYQFERVWRTPEKYIDILKKFKCVMSPDFSLYSDFPVAMQIYNHYRKHALGVYWQSLGIDVIPTICWSDEKSFDWCFDGEPRHSTVAVSSVGTQNNKDIRQAFMLGYNEMMKRLQPEKIIFYGKVPKECYGNIYNIQSFQSKFNVEKTILR